MKNDIKMNYGGQAVVEGVMFGGKKLAVTAIRRKNGSIEFFEDIKKEHHLLNKLKRIPFLRGIIGLIEAGAYGSKHLNFSTERYDVDPSEDDSHTENETKSSSGLVLIFGAAIVGILSMLFGKLLFTVVPAVLEQLLFSHIPVTQFIHNLIEGFIKIIFLLVYIWAISLTPMIKRLFQYHGAEHKVINAYEAGVELTVSNVQKFSTLHYRCGSSFIVFTVIVGVIVYSFFTYETLWERIWQRILLLPVVIGISYEILQFTNRLRNIPVLRYLGYPGLWLQKLTTREPDDDQVEIAIASFNRLRERERKIHEGQSLASTG